MTEIRRIHHIAMLVENIQASLVFWQDILGLAPSRISEAPQEAARIAFLPVGETEIELVQPVSTDSSLNRFLEKHGPGMHHLCLEVDDLDGMLTTLKTKRILLINDQPKVDEDGRRYAFVHPKSTGGLLLELYQLPE